MSVLELVPERTPQPSGPSLARPTASNHRLVVVGARGVTGRGESPGAPAFSGCLARLLGRALGHGIDFDSVIAQDPTISGLERAVGPAPIEYADSVVLVIEEDGTSQDAGTAVHRMLASTGARMREGAVLVAVVVAPARAAETGDLKFIDSVRAAAHHIAIVVEIATVASERPLEWARLVAEAVAAHLPPAVRWWLDPATTNEAVRSQAAHRFLSVSESAHDELERIVEDASGAYGTQSASLTVIAGWTAHFLATHNMDVARLSWYETLCHTAVHGSSSVMVLDARTDVRFAQLDVVRRGEVGFYAAHPILSPGGLTVGALCVWHPEARDGADPATLEVLGMQAEGIFWRELEVARDQHRLIA